MRAGDAASDRTGAWSQSILLARFGSADAAVTLLLLGSGASFIAARVFAGRRMFAVIGIVLLLVVQPDSDEQP